MSARINPQLRFESMRMAERIADIAFEGRTGHGGGKASCRQMSREELIVLLAVAFERGAELDLTRTPTPPERAAG